MYIYLYNSMPKVHSIHASVTADLPSNILSMGTPCDGFIDMLFLCIRIKEENEPVQEIGRDLCDRIYIELKHFQ